jgi:hypothetical protein
MSKFEMSVLHVVNVSWFAGQVTWLARELWGTIPAEITATAEAHPSRALLTLGVLVLVIARVAMVSGGFVAVMATRLLLVAAGLLLLMELEILALSMGSVFSMLNEERRDSLET